MIEKNFEKCFGCSVCEAVCARGAIRMVPNSEGFLVPSIDEALCTECRACQKACIMEKPRSEGTFRAYAFVHGNPAVREAATSGGAFSALSDIILEEGGTVFGVVYDEGFTARHVRAETAAERDAMMGSKYVQSDMGGILGSLLSDLSEGRSVLFTGTPCQVDAVKSLCAHKRISTEKLTTLALVCHGVPSPMILRDHIAHLEAARGERVVTYYHRKKVRGWHEHNELAVFESGKREYFTKRSQNFKDLFYGHYIVRPSCHSCPYAELPVTADITVGDFWGIEDLFPERDDNRGTSIVLTASERGDALLDRLRARGTVFPVVAEDALRFNHRKPVKPNPNREAFWRDYEKHGFSYVARQYAKDSPAGRLKYYTRKLLRILLVKLRLKHL